MPKVRYLFLILFLPTLFGCDDEEQKLRDWQRDQVAQLQRQSQENSAAARALVEADAASRRQFVDLQQSVQVERQELSEQYAAVDTDRKSLAAARERVPLLATAFQGLAALVLGIAALVICGRLLRGLSSDDATTELEETLILAVAGETDLLTNRQPLLQPPPEVPAISGTPADNGAIALVDE